MAIYMWKDHTLAYFPLQGDGLDVKGNYTLSNTGTQQTLGRRFTSNSYLNAIPTGVKTLLAWVKLNSYGVTDSGQSILLRGVTRNSNMLIQHRSSDPYNYKYPSFYMYYNGREYWIAQNVLTTGVWTLIGITWTGTSLNCYLNDTEYTLYTGNYPGVADSCFLVDISGNKTISVDMSKVIFEDISWSHQDFTDYFNATKSDYGY